MYHSRYALELMSVEFRMKMLAYKIDQQQASTDKTVVLVHQITCV